MTTILKKLAVMFWPVMCIAEEQHNTGKILSLKNGLRKIKKRSFAYVMHFHDISKMKSPKEYCLSQLYMSRKNESELKSGTLAFE